MPKSFLTEKQLAKIDKIWQKVKENEKTFQKLDEMSDEITQKWKRRREAREESAKQ